MAKSFREIVAWQLAFELKEKVVALIASSPQAKRDFEFRDQLTDSCKSVPSNIAEGYGRYRPAEIARFLEIAKGSRDETENHLRDGVGSGYFKAEDVGPLIRLAARCLTASTRWQAYLQEAKNDPRFLPRRRATTKRSKNPREEPS
jgi:four helix bundle protein